MNVFIAGFGNMGKAIAGNLLSTNKYKIYASNRSNKSLPSGIIKDKAYLFLGKADYVIIAAKPQDIPELATNIKAKLNSKSILISIAAGISLKKLSSLFEHKKIIRIMPSLTLTVGQGIAAWKSEGVTGEEKKKIKALLNRITENFEVNDENLIDAGSIIYGSGPAYFFLLAHHLEQASLNLGLSRDQSRKLVEKTFLGSALLQPGQHYADLIKKIASKGGITEAALQVFKNKKLDKIINQAVQAGFKRTKELNNG
jgi:pyrroline-5-carboxylate reductase